MHFYHAALTDVGLKRRTNEDAYIIEEQGDRLLFGIADGMGGHACGDIASRTACQELKGFTGDTGENPRECTIRLRQRFLQIDDSLRIYSEKNPSCQGMGTTLSAIVFLRRTAVTAHVGDSRIYRLRSKTLRQLTTDHTLVEEMVKEGLIKTDDAPFHPFRNKLTHVIGTSEQLDTVETRTFTVAAGDRYMLSTDGLHNGVTEEEIQEILSANNSPHDAAEEFLKLALSRDGKDNITVIAIFAQ